MKSAAVLLDASATLAWLLDDEADGPAYDTLLSGRELFATSLWQLEVVNALLKRERQKRLSRGQVDRLLRQLDALGVRILPDPDPRSLVGLAELARPHQLSSYDASYLDAALTHGLPLATEDNNLRQACQALGVVLLSPG
ncbi:MAG: type II toxin-antitoxin system VapC family toxin [Phycisphaeraceae bacterium]